MRLFILLAVLFVPTLTHAQARGSILDDPDFLENLGVDPEPVNVSNPPCENCREGGSRPHIQAFIRDRRNGNTFPMSENVSGVDCVSTRRYIRNSGEAGDPGGVSLCQRSGSMNRELNFLSVDGSREGAFMYFQENVNAADSRNGKTAVVMLPRRSIPNVRVVGDELHLTLSTGELAVFDARTKQYLRGPLRFGPIAATNRVTPFSYSGRAISISASHNGIIPFELGRTAREQAQQRAAMVTVKQGNTSCQVSRGALFSDNGSTLLVSDSAMVTVINRACAPKSFNLP